VPLKFAFGVGRTVVVAGFAALIAAHTIYALVSTQLQGMGGNKQDIQAKAERWDWATQWSLPKRETLGLIVPGLFGYKMDTPDGGNYWGAMGRDPSWDRYFENGKQGNPPGGFLRHTGGGNYGGVLVALVALWAACQSLRKQDSVFSLTQRKLIWFFLGTWILALLVAFGRHAPLYRLLYALPYFSTIRNPTKFLSIFHFSMTVLFAFGIHGLSRKYMEVSLSSASDLQTRFKTWWVKAKQFDRRWVTGCALAVALSLIGWLMYASSRQSLEQYLQNVQFDETLSRMIAAFSIRQVGWFVLFFVLGAGLLTLILCGAFAGPRARWGGALLGLVLVADLGRANLPFIIYWNYKEKYASNPIIEMLREKPYEHRVAQLPFKAPPQLGLFHDLYGIEWSQQLFTYYNIESLDVIQMPRVPEDLGAFEGALFMDNSNEERMRATVHRIARRWQLTNTRYLLGPAGFLDLLNQQLDPVQHRFQVVARFDVVPKPEIVNPTSLEQLTAVVKPEGQYALFDFTGALPRASLYTNWQVSTNDQATLQRLASLDFDPAKTVLVANATAAAPVTNAPPGTVEYPPNTYTPKHIVLSTKATAPSILLLNDKFDPDWTVFVDAKPAQLLRCNFIMRGVQVPAGNHTVEFKFSLPSGTFYVSLAGLLLALGLVGILGFVGPAEPPEATVAPQPLSPPERKNLERAAADRGTLARKG
jgi:hypothetical protein